MITPIHPPAGRRWREVAHPFAHGVVWRYTDRLQVKYGDDAIGWRDVSMLRDVGPEQIAVIHDLMQNNTVPDPDYVPKAEVVRDGVWEGVSKAVTMYALGHQNVGQTTDTIVRLLRKPADDQHKRFNTAALQYIVKRYTYENGEPKDSMPAWAHVMSDLLMFGETDADVSSEPTAPQIVEVLPGFWNVYAFSDGSWQLNKHLTAESAREYELPHCGHVAATLAIVTDAAPTPEGE